MLTQFKSRLLALGLACLPLAVVLTEAAGLMKI